MSGSAPISARDFAKLIAPLGPFEAAPHLAVAVSGGRDSLALCLLAEDWARAQDGRITALTVDHRLRQGSAAEAAQVGGWLGARSIAHEILVRKGPAPKTGVQDFARTARIDLLEDWCIANRVLHLLLAHHQNDQAETVLIRLAAHSGPDGLAGMAAVTESRGVRRLRPLLDVPRGRLQATLEAAGHPWIDDPSNRDTAHQRIRIRQRLADGPLQPAALADAARELGIHRAKTEREVFDLLARSVSLHDAGFAWLKPDILADARKPTALRALGRLVTTLSGALYTPRQEKLERLLERLRTGDIAGGRTLHGCRIAPRKRAPTSPGLLVARELRAIAPETFLEPGESRLWDGRYRVTVPADFPVPVRVMALGRLEPALPRGKTSGTSLPRLAHAALPVLVSPEQCLYVPHLGLGLGRSFLADRPIVRYAPRNPLTTAGFSIVLNSS